MNSYIDIIVILFGLIVVFSTKFTTIKYQHEDYIDIESTMGLRGILAILIILHHMSEKISGGYLFPLFNHLGYLVVAVFFFLSGYGLLVSYNKKGDNYLKSFFKRRILYLVIVYFIVTVFYTIWFYIIQRPVSAKRFFTGFLTRETIAGNSWYIVVQIVLYVFFLAVFSIKPINTKSKIFIISVLIAVLAVYYWKMDYYVYWYMSTFAFVFGMLWAEHKKNIDALLKKHYLLSVIIVFAAFGVFSIMPIIFNHFGYESNFIWVVSRMLSSTVFCFVIMILLRIAKPSKQPLKFLGSISLEIYLFQCMVYVSLRNEFFSINNDFLWVVLTVALTIIVAWVDHLLNKKINVFLTNGRRKNNE